MLSATDYMSIVANDINALAGMFERYLSGADNLRIVSIILMLLAFILFLFLIIILYVKSIISFLKSENKKTPAPYETVSEEDEAATALDDELELERELERELELSRAAKFRSDAEEQKQREQEQQEKEKMLPEPRVAAAKENNKNNMLDLDWKKGKRPEADAAVPPIDPAALQYKQSRKSLEDLIGLIIDMIGRGVDELKIAQTIMFRNQGENSEEDIIQTVEAIKEFVALCVSGKFKGLSAEKNLPAEDEALFHLAKGDASLALALLEALMDKNIEYSAALPVGDKRDALFAETSGYASVFGTLAAMSDPHLATGSFELAVELSPQNVNAWSRLADMYHLLESHQKAMWAYQQVLEMADEELSPQQIANANKILSQYYYAQGNSLQAAKLYNQSKQFYDSIGINRRLDKKEIEIIEIIESRQQNDLETTIARLLSGNSTRNGYA